MILFEIDKYISGEVVGGFLIAANNSEEAISLIPYQKNGVLKVVSSLNIPDEAAIISSHKVKVENRTSYGGRSED